MQEYRNSIKIIQENYGRFNSLYFENAVKKIVEKKRLEKYGRQNFNLNPNYKINLAWRLGVKTLYT